MAPATTSSMKVSCCSLERLGSSYGSRSSKPFFLMTSMTSEMALVRLLENGDLANETGLSSGLGCYSPQVALNDSRVLGGHLGREGGLVVVHESRVRDNDKRAVDLHRVRNGAST